MRSLLLVLLLAVPAAAQPAADAAPELHPALAPFAGLVGQWQGEARARGRDGETVLIQTEDVRVGLGGAILTVEGRGRAVGEDGAPGETLFNAHGVFSVDGETGAVYLDAFTHENRHTRVRPTPVDGGFDWGIEPENDPRIAYAMRFDEAGRWTEAGRMTFDDGATWIPFFEMTLERVAE